VPKVHTDLSSRRVLVTDLLQGRRFEQVKALDDAERDRFGEIVFRFYFSLLQRTGRVCGDPHPGNYLLLDDGRVGFLDFGLMRMLDKDYLEGERRLARAVVAEDAEEVHAILTRLGYLPDPDDFVPEALLEWLLAAGEWYLQPGWRRLSPQYVTELIDATASPRSPWFEQQRRMTVPPQALLIRRMEGPDLRDARRAPRGRRLVRAGKGVLRRRADGCLRSGPMRRLALLLPGLLMLLAPVGASGEPALRLRHPKAGGEAARRGQEEHRHPGAPAQQDEHRVPQALLGRPRPQDALQVRDRRGPRLPLRDRLLRRRVPRPPGRPRERQAEGQARPRPTGWFHPTRCGASCASPGSSGSRDGVLYELEAKLGTKSTERRILTRLANSAIRGRRALDAKPGSLLPSEG
jgi:hypothetical protein